MGQTKPEPPKFDKREYGEDYSYLREPENRTGAWWEPIKFIAFHPAGTHYFTMGADKRVRHERFTHNRWGDGSAPNDAPRLVQGDALCRLASGTQSYVTDDKSYRLYVARDEVTVRAHAQKGGFPANVLLACAR